MKHPTITVNLDEANRASVIAAACMALSLNGARAGELGEWRQRASAWDESELLLRASECGIRFVRRNEPR
jgi:hypothetical protein